MGLRLPLRDLVWQPRRKKLVTALSKHSARQRGFGQTSAMRRKENGGIKYLKKEIYGYRSGSASNNRRHTHSRHGPFAYRHPLVAAAAGCRFVLSPDRQSAVRKRQAAASGERAG